MEFYKMFGTISWGKITADEFVKFLLYPDLGNNEKLDLISDWVEANADNFKNADLIVSMFACFLAYIDATQLSSSAINKFLRRKSLFANNHDCR